MERKKGQKEQLAYQQPVKGKNGNSVFQQHDYCRGRFSSLFAPI
jgi:hypothetical protein